MVESSDLQGAIQRTQAMEKVASLQNQQEELNRKRFELELARESAEKAKKARDVAKAETKRVLEDRYDGERQADGETPRDDRDTNEDRQGEAGNREPDGRPPAGGSLDVRV